MHLNIEINNKVIWTLNKVIIICIGTTTIICRVVEIIDEV